MPVKILVLAAGVKVAKRGFVAVDPQEVLAADPWRAPTQDRSKIFPDLHHLARRTRRGVRAMAIPDRWPAIGSATKCASSWASSTNASTRGPTASGAGSTRACASAPKGVTFPSATSRPERRGNWYATGTRQCPRPCRTGFDGSGARFSRFPGKVQALLRWERTSTAGQVVRG